MLLMQMHKHEAEQQRERAPEVRVEARLAARARLYGDRAVEEARARPRAQPALERQLDVAQHRPSLAETAPHRRLARLDMEDGEAREDHVVPAQHGIAAELGRAAVQEVRRRRALPAGRPGWSHLDRPARRDVG